MRQLFIPMIDLQERRQRIFDEDGGVDFAYSLEVDGLIWRFRVNILQQMGHMGLVARRVNNKIPNFEGLHLPPGLASLCTFTRHHPAGRRDGFRQEHDHRLDVRLDQPPFSTSTSSRSKTLSSSPLPTTSRLSTSAKSAWT